MTNSNEFAPSIRFHHATRAKAARLVETLAAEYPRLTLEVVPGDKIDHETYTNDLGMFDAAGLSVAYCAKPVTAAAADVAIGFPRLDAVAAFAFPSF